MEPITPTDVLAFGVTAPAVRDRYLKDARSPLGEPGGYLGLDAEAIAFEPQVLQDVGGNRLVTRLHVGEVEIVENIGEPGEELVT